MQEHSKHAGFASAGRSANEQATSAFHTRTEKYTGQAAKVHVQEADTEPTNGSSLAPALNTVQSISCYTIEDVLFSMTLTLASSNCLHSAVLTLNGF